MTTLTTHSKVSAYFVAILTLLVLGGCRPGPAPEAEAELPQAVRVTTARQGTVIEGRRSLATAVSADTVRVLAQVPGTVVELPVAPGAAAARRDVLGRIGAPELAARLTRVRAEAARAERQRDFACEHLVTDRELAAAGALTSEQLDRSETACSSAELAVEAAQAAGSEVGAASAKALERAPFAGRVLEHFVDVGQAVMPGTPLVLFGTEEVELLLRIPQEDLDAGFGLGAEVMFEGGRGAVSEVGGQARGPGALVDLRVTVAEGAPPLRVGTRLAVRLVTEQRHGTSVPLDALGADREGDFVLLVEGERATRVPVVLGPRDAGWVAIEPALPPGSQVVVRGVTAVRLDAPLVIVEVGS